MIAKRLQWIFALVTALAGAVILYAQNPVSISQVGTTPVTTAVPVSGTVTANAGSGTFAVSGPLTDTQLRATAVPVSGTVTANMGTVTADPFGANADAASATGSMSAKLRFIASTGIPITGTVTVASHAVTVASGGIASGAVASGAVASGAFASGAIGSGAIASGAIASGAIASGAVASGAYGSDSGSFGVGATGSAVPAKSAYTGVNAATALPSAATAGNLTGVMGDKFGRQVALVGSVRDLQACQGTTISASTSETTVVTAGGSGVFADVWLLVISNTSASTNSRVDIRDATAGTVLFSLYSMSGAGPVGFSLARALPQTTANNNWTAQAATSTTDLRVYACYDKNK